MKEIKIEWFWKDIENNLLSALSDNYNLDLSFDYNEESEDEIKDVFIRFYECKEKCSFEEAVEWNIIDDLTWIWYFTGQKYGRSEYTIEWFNVNDFKIWNHYLRDIFKDKKDKYIHLIFSY